MNGRIYDPHIARFVQADPFIQAPTDTQMLNRYSYVRNNPLNATDPSGYFKLREAVGIIVAIIGTYICGPECGKLGYALVGAISGAAGAAANGGNILQGAIIGGISGAAFSAVGGSNTFGYTLGDGFGQLAINAAANGFVGGIMNVLMGGKFGHGFAAAGLSAFAKPGIRKTFGIKSSGLPARVIARAVIGGSISSATGGKFSNGAITAAFSQLFNEEPTLKREFEAQQRLNFAKLKNAYNRDGYDVVDSAGGKVTSNFSLRNSDDPEIAICWVNTCAAKMSHAMNGAGDPIPHPSDLPTDIRALTSENGNYIYGAADFGRYMNKYGTPLTVNHDLSNIQGKSGVIYFENYHVDLWDGSTNNMVGNGNSASSYIENHKAYFWEAE